MSSIFRKTGAWISRSKFPNLWRAEGVAKKLGLTDGGKVGENLSFAEQMDRKAERAVVARKTAEQTRPTDKGFIIRRINDAEKTIRAQKKNLEKYYSKLEKIEQGEVIKRIDSGNVITAEEVQNWIEEAELIIENAISKSIYYHECLEAVGDVSFSQENIKVGFIVDLDRWGKCKITGKGQKNVSYMISEERITLKSGTDKAIIRKPRKVSDRSSESGYSWGIDIVKGMHGTVYNSP